MPHRLSKIRSKNGWLFTEGTGRPTFLSKNFASSIKPTAQILCTPMAAYLALKSSRQMTLWLGGKNNAPLMHWFLMKFGYAVTLGMYKKPLKPALPMLDLWA